MKPFADALARHPFLHEALGASVYQTKEGAPAIEAAAFRMNTMDGRSIHRAAIAGIAIFAAETALAAAAPAGKRAAITDLNFSFVYEATGQVNAAAELGALDWDTTKKQSGQVRVTDAAGAIFAIMDFDVQVAPNK